MTWLPIETAPKDGTRIDLWMVTEKYEAWRVTDAYWVSDCDDEFTSFDSGNAVRLSEKRDGWFAPNYDYDGQDGFCDQPVRRYGKPLADTWTAPTHWMPLPDPPV